MKKNINFLLNLFFLISLTKIDILSSKKKKKSKAGVIAGGVTAGSILAAAIDVGIAAYKKYQNKEISLKQIVENFDNDNFQNSRSNINNNNDVRNLKNETFSPENPFGDKFISFGERDLNNMKINYLTDDLYTKDRGREALAKKIKTENPKIKEEEELNTQIESQIPRKGFV
jgi:hypothetical protein